MEDTEQQPIRVEIERLTTIGWVKEMAHGLGVTSGLALLAGLELVRNAYFRLLDLLGVRPRRHRRASAFPPGRPRKHTIVQN